MIKNRALGHLGMASSDVEATVKWYTDVLGFQSIGSFAAPDGGRIDFIRNEEGCVYEIFPAPSEEPDAAYGKIDHYCYVSDDVEADYEYCLQMGYTITTDGIEGIPTLWENGVRYFKIGALTGQEIEFCQIL